MKKTLLSALVILGLGATGCGGQKVQVYLTDAPLDGATAVNITVHGLEVVGGGGKDLKNDEDDDNGLPTDSDEDGDSSKGRKGGHTTLEFDEAREINLLELRNGVRTLLGEVEVEGHIGQLRLLMDGSATVVYQDGSSREAFVPSGAQTGVKIVNIPDGVGEITLDFDAAQSIHETGDGELVMRPTIRALVDEKVVGENNPLEDQLQEPDDQSTP